jgi:hypothetical protein
MRSWLGFDSQYKGLCAFTCWSAVLAIQFEAHLTVGHRAALPGPGQPGQRIPCGVHEEERSASVGHCHLGVSPRGSLSDVSIIPSQLARKVYS